MTRDLNGRLRRLERRRSVPPPDTRPLRLSTGETVRIPVLDAIRLQIELNKLAYPDQFPDARPDPELVALFRDSQPIRDEPQFFTTCRHLIHHPLDPEVVAEQLAEWDQLLAGYRMVGLIDE